MKPIANQRLDLMRTLWAQRQPRNAVYIFIKHAVDRLHSEARLLLQKRAACVIHDHIDRSLDRIVTEGIDLHLASSIAQEAALRDRLNKSNAIPARTGLLLHQADIRLANLRERPLGALRAAYFGSPKNAFLPEPVAARIKVVNVELGSSMTANLGAFGLANLHYAIRPDEQTTHRAVFKPLTKAVTAAACGAPVLINRAACDAEALLGQDYPYLVNTVTTESVLALMDRVQTGYGGSEWLNALDRMHTLRERLLPSQVAKNFETMMEELL
jgi:hypothetical protein